MASIDLHPEDLLERPIDDLDAADRQRLQAHLRHCAACRMEQQVRDDFRHVADRADLDVRTIVSTFLVRQGVRPDRRRMRPRLRMAFVVAAVLVLTGLAAAATRWPLLLASWPARTPWASLQTRSPERSQPIAAKAVAPVASVDSTTPLLSTSSEGPAAPAAPSTPETHSATMPTFPLHATPQRASSPAREDAAVLFAAANAARRRGDHQAARASYERLIGQYSTSLEARESLVVLGRMLLDDGNAPGALRAFEAYLNRHGTLTAEALLGKALALEELGRAREEQTAWRALLDSYPTSVHADRARARLAELGR